MNKTPLEKRPYYEQAKAIYNGCKTHGDAVEAIRVGLHLQSFLRKSKKTLAFGGTPTTALGRAVRKFIDDVTEILEAQ